MLRKSRAQRDFIQRMDEKRWQNQKPEQSASTCTPIPGSLWSGETEESRTPQTALTADAPPISSAACANTSESSETLEASKPQGRKPKENGQVRYKELSVSVSRNMWKQNPQGSETHTAGLTVELEATDNPQEVEAELRLWCKQAVRAAFMKNNNNSEETKPA